MDFPRPPMQDEVVKQHVILSAVTVTIAFSTESNKLSQPIHFEAVTVLLYFGRGLARHTTYKDESRPLPNASDTPAVSPTNHWRIHYARDSLVKKAGCVQTYENLTIAQ